jgi:transcriptional regulator with XRE-family HTH domain
VTATLKEIARRTGKSITTVSRALADYDDVSPETKKLVRRVADEIGYSPNLLARRLQKRRSETIGLILPTFSPRFSDPFFSEFLAGVGNRAARSGYDLLVSTQAPGSDEPQVYRRKVQGKQVDGLIVVRTRRQDARIDYLRRAGVPRSLNRHKFDRAALEATLADPAAHERRVLDSTRRLLRLHRAEPAFHPGGGQQVLDPGPAVFAVLRTPPGSGRPVLCLVNVSCRPQAVSLAAGAGWGYGGEAWWDLIGGPPRRGQGRRSS